MNRRPFYPRWPKFRHILRFLKPWPFSPDSRGRKRRPGISQSMKTITVSTSPTVLIACSDSATIDSMAASLESWHYQVEVAHNGADTRARLEAPTPPAISLLDMNLRGPAATEVVWQIRRLEQRSSWIIFFSNRRGKEHACAALACGGDDFLFRASDPSELNADLKVRIRVAERVLALSSRVQKQGAELRYHVSHDGLTGLWNREALLSLVFQETDRVQRLRTPLSLMLLDLDDFSLINHNYGYEVGDRVLIELANRFRRQLRSYDLIGRCGEDEFLLALPGCTLEQGVILGNRIRESILGRPFALDHDATTLNASFGVAISNGRSPLIVLREAERALAQAKIAGKNCVRGDSPDSLLLEPLLASEASNLGPEPE